MIQKIYKNRYIRVCLFVVIIFGMSIVLGNISDNQIAEISNGYLDLSSINLSQQGTIELRGQWEFYDGVFLDGTNSAQSQYIDVPGIWNDVKGSKGFGTYRAVLRVNDKDQIYGIKIPIVSSCCGVFINGKAIGGNGHPADNELAEVGSWTTKVKYFEVDSEEIEILVHVSNYAHSKGGIVWGNFEFGTQDNISKSRAIKIGVTFLVFGFILAIGIYHITIFLYKRKNKASLYFSVFCLLMALRILLTGENLFTVLIMELPLELHAKLEYATIPLASLFLILYLAQSGTGAFYRGRIFKVMKSFLLGYATLILVTKLWIYSKLVVISYIIIMIYLLAEVTENIKRCDKQIVSEKITFYSSLIFMISIINDIFYTYSYMDDYYIYIGTLVMVIGNTIKMSLSVARYHERIEDWYKSLDREVKERTKELDVANKQLYNLATRDALTELYNRQYLEQRLTQNIEECSILYIDLDNFKFFNDIYGHIVGDFIIREFATILKDSVGNRGDTFRMGGDEFMILLPRLDITEAKKIAIDIIGTMEDNEFVHRSVSENFSSIKIDPSQRITCSIGITYTPVKTCVGELINIADKAMLEAKDEGKNCYVVKESIIEMVKLNDENIIS